MRTLKRVLVVIAIVLACIVLLPVVLFNIYKIIQFNKPGNMMLGETLYPSVGEMDQRGFIVWEYMVPGLPEKGETGGNIFVRRLRNGNTIIVNEILNKVLEVSRAKKIVWEYGDSSRGERLHSPQSAYRLENGDTYITDLENNRIIRVNQQREIVWEYQNKDTLKWVWDVHVVEGELKHIVFSSDGAFVGGYSELDESGEPTNYRSVEKYPGRSLQFLENRNVFVSGYSYYLWELDSAGNVVWEYNLPPDEQRLPGTHDLVPPVIEAAVKLRNGNVVIERCRPLPVPLPNYVEIDNSKEILREYGLNKIMTYWYYIFERRDLPFHFYSSSTSLQVIEGP